MRLYRAPDDAIVFHSMGLMERVVGPHDELHAFFTYDKRESCVGAKTIGEYYVRIWFPDGATMTARKPSDVYSAQADPAGQNQPARLTIRLAHIFPPLEPGEYDVQLIGYFKCRGEGPQRIDGPLAHFVVSS